MKWMVAVVAALLLLSGCGQSPEVKVQPMNDEHTKLLGELVKEQRDANANMQRLLDRMKNPVGDDKDIKEFEDQISKALKSFADLARPDPEADRLLEELTKKNKVIFDKQVEEARHKIAEVRKLYEESQQRKQVIKN